METLGSLERPDYQAAGRKREVRRRMRTRPLSSSHRMVTKRVSKDMRLMSLIVNVTFSRFLSPGKRCQSVVFPRHCLPDRQRVPGRGDIVSPNYARAILDRDESGSDAR